MVVQEVSELPETLEVPGLDPEVVQEVSELPETLETHGLDGEVVQEVPGLPETLEDARNVEVELPEPEVCHRLGLL